MCELNGNGHHKEPPPIPPALVSVSPPPPALMPKTGFYEKNGPNREYKFNNSRPTNTTTKDERNIVSEMNKMYKHSPFVQRRSGGGDVASDADYGSGSSPVASKDAIYNNLGES